MYDEQKRKSKKNLKSISEITWYEYFILKNQIKSIKIDQSRIQTFRLDEQIILIVYNNKKWIVKLSLNFQ